MLARLVDGGVFGAVAFLRGGLGIVHRQTVDVVDEGRFRLIFGEFRNESILGSKILLEKIVFGSKFWGIV